MRDRASGLGTHRAATRRLHSRSVSVCLSLSHTNTLSSWAPLGRGEPLSLTILIDTTPLAPRAAAHSADADTEAQACPVGHTGGMWWGQNSGCRLPGLPPLSLTGWGESWRVSSGNRKGSVIPFLVDCGGDVTEHMVTGTLSSGGAETTSETIPGLTGSQSPSTAEPVPLCVREQRAPRKLLKATHREGHLAAFGIQTPPEGDVGRNGGRLLKP